MLVMPDPWQTQCRCVLVYVAVYLVADTELGLCLRISSCVPAFVHLHVYLLVYICMCACICIPMCVSASACLDMYLHVHVV